MAVQDTVGVAVVGCGTVGSNVVRLLCADAAMLRRRSGVRLELRHMVDKDFTRARQAGADEKLFRGDLKPVLADPKTRIVVELIGGTTIAKTIVEQALRAGKHVVTANKALLAHHGAGAVRAGPQARACASPSRPVAPAASRSSAPATTG